MNDLGVFGSIQEVWELYPNGGMEGDVLTIDGLIYSWDNYNLVWKSEEEDTPSESGGYLLRSVEGDLSVQNDLHVGGVLHANNIEIASKGLFLTEADLKDAFPNPKNGDWAIVGDVIPGPIWSAVEGVWTSTGEMGGGAEINLSKYVKKEFLDGQVKEINGSIDHNVKILTETMNAHVKKIDKSIEMITPILLTEQEFAKLEHPDPDLIYYVYEEE